MPNDDLYYKVLELVEKYEKDTNKMASMQYANNDVTLLRDVCNNDDIIKRIENRLYRGIYDMNLPQPN